MAADELFHDLVGAAHAKLRLPARILGIMAQLYAKVNGKTRRRIRPGFAVPLGAMKSLFSAILLCLFGLTCASAKTPGEIDIGGTLRDAPMQGLNGPARKLSEFRGKPLIINVWASWCGPCQQEMGSLERLAWHEEFGKMTVIGISTDDYPDAAKAFLRKTNATFNHYIDSRQLLEIFWRRRFANRNPCPSRDRVVIVLGEFQVEIVTAGQAGLVDDGAVRQGAQ